MQRKNRESLILGPLLKKIAPQIGATVVIEPEWQVVGQITFKTGHHSYFRYNTLDLNPMGASEIARDKDYADFFMKKLGYPTIPQSKTFFSDSWAQAIGSTDRTIDYAYEYAKNIGFPVVVKPNSGSQGVAVSLVYNKQEFYKAIKTIFKTDRVALVQKPVTGKDYRIVVLDDEIISAYERVPLSIIGDGTSTIQQLLELKQQTFIASSRDTKINIEDPRILRKLQHQKLSFTSVPLKDQKVFLLDNANLSSGGDSIDVTEHIHPSFKKIAINLTKDMGLRLCGVDMMIDGTIDKATDKYHIIEINSAPGLDHYAKIGIAQEKIVEEFYIKVLKHMEH